MKRSSMMYLEEGSMSNLTSASNEASPDASLSSSSNYKNNNNNEVVIGTPPLINNMYPPPQHSSFPHHSVPINNNNNNSNNNSTHQSNKKKRNLPGNPDPEAEVIAMSPKTLMATNRFVCEICNKGFQRDQNLQLHRRGHNLPWKLKQRSKQEVVRKKVYICPEPSCVHHEPSRALGDLTGIKKHFSRKHGEKKWKCDKCSKRYAVQSDWKAHSKICGTREYRCDCGTLFSRRDSFITHRAFCGALAGETIRSSSSSSLLLSSPPAANHLLLPFHNNLPINFPLIKTEPQQQQHFYQQHSQQLNNVLQQNHQLLPSAWFAHNNYHQQNPNGNNGNNDNNNNIHQQLPCPPPHDILSATALLQKAAAQMGVTMSNNKSVYSSAASMSTTNPTTSANIHVMSQQQEQEQEQEQQQSIQSGSHQLHDHMCAPTSLFTAHPHDSGPANLSSSGGDHEDQQAAGIFGLSGSTNAFQEAYNGMLCSTKSSMIPAGGVFQEPFFPCTSASTESTSLNPTIGGSSTTGGAGNELTIDFLGITGYPPPNDQQHFLSMAGLDHLGTSSASHYDQQHHHSSHNQNRLPAWHG